MSPSLKRLQSFADITLILGPLLLIAGLVVAFSFGGLIALPGTLAASIGGILWLAGLTNRAVELGVHAAQEAAAAAVTDAPQPTNPLPAD